MKKNVEHYHKTKECKKTTSKTKLAHKIKKEQALNWTFGISSIVMLFWR